MLPEEWVGIEGKSWALNLHGEEAKKDKVLSCLICHHRTYIGIKGKSWVLNLHGEEAKKEKVLSFLICHP